MVDEVVTRLHRHLRETWISCHILESLSTLLGESVLAPQRDFSSAEQSVVVERQSLSVSMTDIVSNSSLQVIERNVNTFAFPGIQILEYMERSKLKGISPSTIQCMDLHVGSLLMLKVAEQKLIDNDSIGVPM